MRCSREIESDDAYSGCGLSCHVQQLREIDGVSALTGARAWFGLQTRLLWETAEAFFWRSMINAKREPRPRLSRLVSRERSSFCGI